MKDDAQIIADIEDRLRRLESDPPPVVPPSPYLISGAGYGWTHDNDSSIWLPSIDGDQWSTGWGGNADDGWTVYEVMNTGIELDYARPAGYPDLYGAFIAPEGGFYRLSLNWIFTIHGTWTGLGDPHFFQPHWFPYQAGPNWPYAFVQGDGRWGEIHPRVNNVLSGTPPYRATFHGETFMDFAGGFGNWQPGQAYNLGIISMRFFDANMQKIYDGIGWEWLDQDSWANMQMEGSVFWKINKLNYSDPRGT